MVSIYSGCWCCSCIMEKQWNTNQKFHTNRKQPNNETCFDVKPPTPSPHLLLVLLLLPMSQLELQQLLELPSKKAPAPHGVGQWGGPKNPRTWLTFGGNGCVFVCVFSFWKEIKSMKVYWNLKDRNGNSAKDNLDSKRFRDWWVWCEGAKYSQMLRLLSRVFEGCGNKQSHKYWLKVSMSTDLRYQ